MTSASDADFDALRSFIDDNEDLERLETLLDQFNLFESLGLVRHEIRHSSFIRWLLDPSGTHGLGDYWLRQFLRQVIKAGEGTAGNFPTLFDLDGWNLGRTEVRKEWRNIDLLILDEHNRFVCAIENEVDSGEGPGQLQRYRKDVGQHFPNYRRALVFLTKFGDKPSDKREAPYWIPISYGDIVSTIENGLKRRESELDDEVRLFIRQYLDMVWRRIVENSEVQELCCKLYENHSRALDLIFKYAPSRADRMSRVIQEYIKSRETLIPGSFTITYLKFLPESLYVLPPGWTQAGGNLMLAWLLENKNEKVQFRLELQPGPSQIREQVYEKAKSLPEIFGKPKPNLSPQFHTFFSETWITPKEYDELDDEGIQRRIEKRIESLMARKGKAMADALKELI